MFSFIQLGRIPDVCMEIKYARKVKHQQTEPTKQKKNKLIGKIFKKKTNGGQNAAASFGNIFVRLYKVSLA